MEQRQLKYLLSLCSIISPLKNSENIKKVNFDAKNDLLGITEIANSHYLTAVLYASLKRKKILNKIHDKEFIAYISHIYNINYSRNENIINQSIFISKSLSQSNIVPVFLKGTASLLHNDYNSLGERFLSDIDFCIIGNQEIALKLLKSNGYIDLLHNHTHNFESHHHYNPMLHNNYDVAIEPHKTILGYSRKDFILCNMDNTSKAMIGNSLLTLTPTLRFLHAYIHTDIVDRHYYKKTIDLRQLYELSVFIHNYRTIIDWDYIVFFLRKYKLYTKFMSTAHLIYTLFDIYCPVLEANYYNKLHTKFVLYLFDKDSSILKYNGRIQHFLFGISKENIEMRYNIKNNKEYYKYLIKYLIQKSI